MVEQIAEIITTAPEEGIFRPVEVPDGFKKAVGVVHVAMGKLGFLHRKIYNVLLANAYEGLGQGERRFVISVASVAEKAGYDSNDYAVLYDSCRELIETKVEFARLGKEIEGKKRRVRSRGATTLLAGFEITRAGEITYSYSAEMAEKLHEPDQYIWMTLSKQRKFKSKYELSLYENTIRYIGVGSTGFKPLDEWKALLGANDKTYDNFKYLNKKVLKPAMEGVNNVSGILVEPEFEREKRRVARIKFAVRENPQQSLLDYKEHEKMRGTEGYEAARKLGLKEVEIFYWIETKGSRYLLEAVEYVQGKAKVENKAAYLIRTLRDGYGEKSDAERKAEDNAKLISKQRRQAKEQAAAKAEAEKAIEDRFQIHRRARFDALIAERTPAELAEIGEAVLGRLPRLPSVRDHWRSIGMNFEKLDGKHAKTIRPFVISEVVDRWGEAEDRELEAYKAREEA